MVGTVSVTANAVVTFVVLFVEATVVEGAAVVALIFSCDISIPTMHLNHKSGEMLAGDNVTDAALSQARALLKVDEPV